MSTMDECLMINIISEIGNAKNPGMKEDSLGSLCHGDSEDSIESADSTEVER